MREEKKHKAFDKAIREKIGNHVASGTEGLWAAIEKNVAQLDAEKKKRRPGFYMWLGLISITGLIVGIYFYQFQPRNFIEDDINSAQSAKPISLYSTLNDSKHRETEHEMVQADSNNKSDSTEYENKQFAQTNTQNMNFSNTVKKTDLNEAGNNNNTNAVGQKWAQENETSSATNLAENEPIIDAIENVIDNKKGMKMATVKADSIDDNSMKTEGDDGLQNDDIAKETPEINDTIAMVLEPSNSDTLATEQAINRLADTTAIDIPGKFKRIKYIELAAQSIRTSAFYKNNGLATGQNEEIELADGFGLHAQFGIKINKRIELFTGLNFEKTELEQRLRTEVDNFDFQTAFGEVHIEEGEYQDEDDFFYVERYFYYLEMPIGIRYNFIARDKWLLNLKGDLLINYLMNQSNRNESYISLGNQTTILPLTFSFGLGIGTQYNFKSGFSIVSDFRYSLMLNSISSDENVVIKPYSIGVGLGIKKYF
ncbi:MAG: outer membrane beta-barrel protein [Crocinitomix sp.]|nr:outer membrane beta-barrel protein [Crocinitomix sp.]